MPSSTKHTTDELTAIAREANAIPDGDEHVGQVAELLKARGVEDPVEVETVTAFMTMETIGGLRQENEALHAEVERLRASSAPGPDVAALRAIPAAWSNPPAEKIEKLPRYVGREQKPNRERGHCQECGAYHEKPAIHLDYFGHANTTLALIAVDPLWSWEPLKWADDMSGPYIAVKENRLVLWAWLTVLGKRVLAVGTCEKGKSDPEKELIGDMLRNGAMRLGIATGLWSKSERDHGDDEPKQGQQRQRPPAQPRGQQKPAQQPQAAPKAAAAPTPPPAEGEAPAPAQAPVETHKDNVVGAVRDLARTLPEEAQARVAAKMEEKGLSWEHPEKWSSADTKLMMAFIAAVSPKPKAAEEAPA